MRTLRIPRVDGPRKLRTRELMMLKQRIKRLKRPLKRFPEPPQHQIISPILSKTKTQPSHRTLYPQARKEAEAAAAAAAAEQDKRY